MRRDRSTSIAKFLCEITVWRGDARANIKLRWPAATPEEIERGISVARVIWQLEDAERARLGAARGGRA